MDGQPGDVSTLEKDLPFLKSIKSRDEIEEARFSGPVRTNHGQYLTLPDIQTDII